MTDVIAIAQRKGGAGKSTLACQLAAALSEAEYSIGGIDLDEQGSFSNWATLRQKTLGEKNNLLVKACKEYELRTALHKWRKSCDIVIIDTPPTVDRAVRSAIAAADLVLTPLQLSPLDLEAVMPTAKLIGDLRMTPLFVINRAPPRARIADLIRAQIKKQRLPVAKTEFGNRAAFSESLAKGLGVVESASSSPAAQEVRLLAGEVLRKLEKAKLAA